MIDPNWLVTAFDSSLPIIITMAATASIGSYVVMLRSIINRRRKQSLRNVLAYHVHPDPDAAEMELAKKLVAAALRPQHDEVADLKFDNYLEDYIVDLRFKPKLTKFIAKEITKTAENPRIEIETLIKTIGTWQEKTTNVESEVRSYLEDLRRTDFEALEALSFVDGRKSYFEEKKQQFVRDVQDAVRVGLTGVRSIPNSQMSD